MYQQTMSYAGQQGQQTRTCKLNDEDLANAVLCELKRVSREYTTACLEAEHPMIHQAFEQLLHRTLTDQHHLFQVMKQLNLYETGASASQQEIQQVEQKKRQSGQKLMSFMQQNRATPNQSNMVGQGWDPPQHADVFNASHPTEQAPSTDMYQSAANTSDFNTTGARQTSSHATGASSTRQQNLNNLINTDIAMKTGKYLSDPSAQGC